MDGGFSNNSPVCSPKTLRVSPFFFDARADVFPSPKVGPWWAIKVPPVDKAWELFEHGERDAVALLQRLQAPNQTIPLKHTNTDANDRSSERFPAEIGAAERAQKHLDLGVLRRSERRHLIQEIAKFLFLSGLASAKMGDRLLQAFVGKKHVPSEWPRARNLV